MGLKINADINACLNITRRVGYNLPTTAKIESYTPTHSEATSKDKGQKDKTTRSQRITPKKSNPGARPSDAGRFRFNKGF